MDSTEKQRVLEENVFNQFLQLQRGQIDLSIEPVYGENPDVILGHIGIELTALHKTKTKELEAAKLEMLSNAKSRCVSKGLLNIEVRVIYSNLIGLRNPYYKVTKLSRPKRNEIAAKLAAQVILSSAELKDGQEIEVQSENIPEIDTIYISRHAVKSTADHHWQVITANHVTRDAIDSIQSALARKENRYSPYREKCDECWLLIHGDRTEPSHAFELSDETLATVYKSSFNRVFYLETFFKYVVELNVSADPSLQG